MTKNEWYVNGSKVAIECVCDNKVGIVTVGVTVFPYASCSNPKCGMIHSALDYGF